MSTIEEMVETFWEKPGGTLHDSKQRMRAVIEKHIGPMIGSAHAAGMMEILTAIQRHEALPRATSDAYAASILAQLKGTP